MDIRVEKIAVISLTVDPSLLNKHPSDVMLKVSPAQEQVDLLKSCDRFEIEIRVQRLIDTLLSEE